MRPGAYTCRIVGFVRRYRAGKCVQYAALMADSKGDTWTMPLVLQDLLPVLP